MSENLFLAVTPNTQDTNLNKDIVSSLTSNWYQKDLAHMTTNLMKVETSPVATALNTTLSPNPMSRSLNLNMNEYGGFYSGGYTGIGLDWRNIGGGGGGWQNDPAKVQSEVNYQTPNIKRIYLQVLGREPTQKELSGTLNRVIYDGKDWNYIQSRIGSSKEAHDDIVGIGKQILGYAPDENWVKQEQAKLAKYGTTQKDIRSDFANSQAAYNSINQVTSSMYGQSVNQATVQFYQANLANGWFQSMQDVKVNFAHSEPVRQASINMMTNMGFTPSEQDIAWIQDQLVNKSFQSVRSEHAQGYHGHDIANKIFKIITGRDLAASDAGWENNLKNNLGRGTSYENVLHQEIKGPFGKMNATEWGRNSLAYAEQMGVNTRALSGVCEIESGCLNLTEVHSVSITGPFQMTKRTYTDSILKAVRENPSLNLTEYQINNGQNIPEIQAIAAAQYLKDAGNAVLGENISNPTALDTRGYYQFGPKYGKLIANATSNQTMGSILTGSADSTFSNNGITRQTTVGEWREMVRNSMGGLADEPILNH